MRRLIPLFFALVLLLSACVRQETTIRVHPADLMSFDVQLRMKRALSEELGYSSQDFVNQAKKSLPAQVQGVAEITPVDEPEWVGTKLTTPPVPANQIEFVDYTRDGGRARLEINLNNINAEEIRELPALKSFGAQVIMTAVFPDEVIASNGVYSGNEVTWDLLELNENPWVEARVGPELWVIIALIGAACLGLVVILVGIVRMLRGRKSRRA